MKINKGKIAKISLAFGLATMLVGCGSSDGGTSNNSDTKTKDFTISDGWIVDAGVDENGTAQKITIGDIELSHQGNGVWRATYTGELIGNLVVPKTAIIDDGDGEYNATTDIQTVGFEMKAPVDYDIVTPLTTVVVDNPSLFPDTIKDKIKFFNPVTALNDTSNNEAKNMLKLTQVAKTYAKLAEVNDKVKLNDFNFTSIISNVDFANDVDLDSEILNAIPNVDDSNIQNTIVQEINQTINSVDNVVAFAKDLKDNNTLSLETDSYNSIIQSTIMQVFDNDKNLTTALDTLKNFDSIESLSDVNISNIQSELSTQISSADTQIESMVESALELNYPALSLDNFNLNDINSTVSNITTLLADANLSLDKFNLFSNFQNLGIGFDMSNITEDLSFQTDIKYSFLYGTSKYLTATIEDLNISISASKDLKIENLSELLGDDYKYTVNVKSNITGTDIDENISIDKSFLSVSDNEQLKVNTMQLLQDISSQVSDVSNLDITLVTSMFSESNKTVKMALGFSSPHDLVDDKLQDLSSVLGDEYKGYEITIDDSFGEKLYENIITLKDLNSTLPVNINDFNISNITNFDITQNISNINLDFLSKITGDFNTTVTTKTKIIIDDSKYVMFTSDPIFLSANATNGVALPNMDDKYITLNTNLTISVTLPFIGTQNVAIPETKIPLSDFIKLDNGKPILEIDRLLDLASGETGSTDLVTAAYQKVIEQINSEIQSASKVELINGFKFEDTTPAEVQTLFDAVLNDTISDSDFDEFKGLKTRIK